MVKAADERAGLGSDLSAHWLRHAHASHSLGRSAPIHLVQATLGHASVATTGRSLHVRPTAARRAVSGFGVAVPHACRGPTGPQADGCNLALVQRWLRHRKPVRRLEVRYPVQTSDRAIADARSHPKAPLPAPLPPTYNEGAADRCRLNGQPRGPALARSHLVQPLEWG